MIPESALDRIVPLELTLPEAHRSQTVGSAWPTVPIGVMDPGVCLAWMAPKTGPIAGLASAARLRVVFRLVQTAAARLKRPRALAW